LRSYAAIIVKTSYSYQMNPDIYFIILHTIDSACL